MIQSYDLESRIQPELDAGERILWCGQPNPGRMWIHAVPILIFGIPWTLFAVFWMAMAIGFGTHASGPPGPFRSLFPLFGLPFVLIGIGMLSAPYWMARTARSTIYAITDKRALVISGGMSLCQI